MHLNLSRKARTANACLNFRIGGSARDITRCMSEGLARGDLVFWRGHVGIMRDAETLLHANAHHMIVKSEPLIEARDRIFAGTRASITSIRRREPFC